MVAWEILVFVIIPVVTYLYIRYVCKKYDGAMWTWKDSLITALMAVIPAFNIVFLIIAIFIAMEEKYES